MENAIEVIKDLRDALQRALHGQVIREYSHLTVRAEQAIKELEEPDPTLGIPDWVLAESTNCGAFANLSGYKEADVEFISEEEDEDGVFTFRYLGSKQPDKVRHYIEKLKISNDG